MKLLTPAMIYCLTLFQGFKQTTLCYCYNRRRGKKAQPRKAKPFSLNMRLQVFHCRQKQNPRSHLLTFGYY